VHMPGMGSPSTSSFSLAGAFYHRVAIEALLLAVVALVLAAARFFLFGTAFRPHTPLAVRGGDESVTREPRAREFLRWSFGVLWLLDGLLQLQSSMPASMTSAVIQPVEQGQPHWLVVAMNWGITSWLRHPIWTASAVVWIQVAIGLWLMLGRSGWFARLGYLLTAGWGLFVWIFGEGLGATFAPGASWLFGSPGAVLFYAVAALLLLAPWSWWQRDRIPRWTLSAVGVMLMAFAVLEAWPGRGFYGPQIPGMISSMAATPQPSVIAASIRWIGSVVGTHGGAALNVLTVVILALTGVSLVTKRGMMPALWVFGIFSVVVWWAVQDFGFLGGTGTDPNSMIPELVLVMAVYMAYRSTEEVPSEDRRFWPETLGQAGRMFGVWIAIAAAVGLVPLGFSALDTSYSIELALASSGAPFALHRPAPPLHLVDQRGTPVSMATFVGKTVAVTDLDPVCTNTCPLIASELRVADLELPAAVRARTVFVAIAANPIFHSVRDVAVFTRDEGMGSLPNWYFVTSPSLPTLAATWRNWGIGLSVPQNGIMVIHPDLVYLVGPHGTERWLVPANPSDTHAVEESFSSLLDHYIVSVTSR
jgi:cytochrome oxidase Cu insertion factor (SCO1/SenC/PrrC family)